MKFEDFKRKVNLKNVVVSRIENLINNGYSTEVIERTKLKLEQCSDHTFAKKCKGCGADYFVGSNSCNNRFCPVCAKKRSLKYLATLIPAFERYLKQGCTVHLLTFTMKNTNNFITGLDTILKAFRYLTNGNKYYANIFKFMFVGGVKSLEVIRGESDIKSYHPHLHCLVIKNKFTRDFDILKEFWNNSLNVVMGTQNEKLGSIDIVQVKNPNSKSNKQNLNDVRTGLLETLKYITKVEDIFNYDDEMLSNFINYSHNRRYVSVFGYLAKLSKALNEDLTESAKDQVGKVCKHCGCTEFEFISEFTNKIGPLEDFD